jgi:hypothetical protein
MHVKILVMSFLFSSAAAMSSVRYEGEEKTARLCVFAYFRRGLDDAVCDSIAKLFDLVVLNDGKRPAVPRIRRRAYSRRRAQPIILVYKDCLTLIGPGNPWGSRGDSVRGGGASVGGFWHFDSIFKGIGYESDTFFLMASDSTSDHDGYLRVKAGNERYRHYRWAMDWAKMYWAEFFARNTKIQCLRNYRNQQYDSTYFDGVFIDNVLHFNKEYGAYPWQYWDSDDPKGSDRRLQAAVSDFLQVIYEEYKNPLTPAGHPNQILGVGNTNGAYQQDRLFQRHAQHLDGGMEEYFAQDWQDLEAWQKIISEVEYAESSGKICLLHTDIDTFMYESLDDPLSVVWYDTTQFMFGFTGYLMGCDSMTYFSFQGDYQHVFHAPILEIDLGQPAGRYVLRDDSVAHREFTKGRVYCNLSNSPRTIDIRRDLYYLITPSGDFLSPAEANIAPRSGVVLKSR